MTLGAQCPRCGVSFSGPVPLAGKKCPLCTATPRREIVRVHVDLIRATLAPLTREDRQDILEEVLGLFEEEDLPTEKTP